MRRLHRALLLCCALLLAGLLPSASPTYAQPVAGAFSVVQPFVGPLQPTTVLVQLPGYTGPATLVVYDSLRQPVGNWEFTATDGAATLTVLPRGALGQHNAVLYASGAPVAEGPLYVLNAAATVQTGVPWLDEFYPRMQTFMDGARLGYDLDGYFVQGYRSPDSALLWLRDHYYQGRAFAYVDQDVTSLLDAFRRAQYPDGSLPDFIDRPEWNIEAFRTPVEADVEYLFVLAVYEAWQMTGDDAWLIDNLEAMQRAINYTLTSPLRWEPSLGLVKRPFTIDTWDFEYGPTTIDPSTGQPAPRHWIDDQTKWGIFHGDNTGLVDALRALARIEDYLGQPEQAQARRDLATMIMIRLNALSWNGSFYRHHVKLVPYDVPGVDEERQLSLSNAMALNRGVLTVEQGRAILDEYRSRLENQANVAFAEWWSIDPPFPPGSFGLAGRLGERPGEYTNGGIMPLVGGELARGAFRFGYEDYGFDILSRYYQLIARTNATFLWYYPTGGPGIGSHETIPTDGWGASAMLGALMEGAAGIEERGVRYSEATISPRWSAAPRDQIDDVYAVARYAASDGYVAYRWQLTRDGGKRTLSLEATGSGERFRVRLMLPPGTKDVTSVTLNGQPAPYIIEAFGTSKYVVLDTPATIVQVHVQVRT